MVRVFYYPVYFRLRKKSEPLALSVATAVVFVATTLLHGYQMFWLQGSFLISKRDVVFWGVLGVLVLITVLREARRGPAKAAPSRPLERGLSIASVYLTISVLWSYWSMDPTRDWRDAILYWR
jgi:hypothetical protein